MKRRAFTLSELLVVVVIIGVLSAVVLPKFSKVIETRKTTEAEELMSAVRTEQEARCTLNKSYTASTASLGSYKDGKNYDYSLGTVGMTASAKSGKYKLEIPSYADGRICCSDIETGACNNLNKNYPLCDDLINHTPDYVAGNADCGVNPPPEPECDKTAKEESCPVPYVGKIYYGVNESCEYYETSRTCECGNKEEHIAGTSTEKDSEGCKVSTTWTFTDYPTCKWDKTETKSDCPSNECDPDAKPATEKDCGCGYTQKRFVKCDASTNYQWEIQTGSNINGSGISSSGEEGWSSCGKPENGATKKEKCLTVQVGSSIQVGSETIQDTVSVYRKLTWSDDSCQWESENEDCCQKHNAYREECSGEQTGYILYVWNYESCKYERDNHCRDKKEKEPEDETSIDGYWVLYNWLTCSTSGTCGAWDSYKSWSRCSSSIMSLPGNPPNPKEACKYVSGRGGQSPGKCQFLSCNAPTDGSGQRQCHAGALSCWRVVNGEKQDW